MSAKSEQFRKAVIDRVLWHKNWCSADTLRAAYDNVAPPHPVFDKVAKTAWKVTDEDIAAAKAAGFTEDQIFELTVCAAVGQSSRQLESARAAVAAALAETKR